MNIRTHSLLLAATLAALSGVPLVAQGTDDKKVAVQDLIEQLGDDSFQVRRDAERALRAQGKDALEALRKASTEHADDEVQWRSRRLLRQIESGEDSGLTPRRPGAVVPGLPRGPYRVETRDTDVGEQFDKIFEQLERDFGMQVPRARFFGGDFFRDLEEQMEGVRRSMAMGIPGGAGQSFSMRMDDKGVRIEIQEKAEDGKSETKVYEAPDVRTFREKYPEIAQRYLNGGDAPRLFSFDTGRWPLQLGAPGRGWVRLGPDAIEQTATADDGGDRLGVFVEPVPQDVRDFLGLAEDTGLRVQSVQDGSLAAKAGIEAGDILLEVAGRKIAAPEDVRAALGAVDPGKEFELKVNRRGGDKTLRGTRPEAEAKKDEKPDGAREEKLTPRRVR